MRNVTPFSDNCHRERTPQPKHLNQPQKQSTMSEVPTPPRIVPGALPPAPLSKSQQKKKRKGPKGDDSQAASPIVVSTPLEASQPDVAPSAAAVKERLVAPQLTATISIDAQSAVDDDLGYKPSPVVDLVHKRLKAITKKIVSSIQSFTLSTRL